MMKKFTSEEITLETLFSLRKKNPHSIHATILSPAKIDNAQIYVFYTEDNQNLQICGMMIFLPTGGMIGGREEEYDEINTISDNFEVNKTAAQIQLVSPLNIPSESQPLLYKTMVLEAIIRAQESGCTNICFAEANIPQYIQKFIKKHCQEHPEQFTLEEKGEKPYKILRVNITGSSGYLH